MAQPDDTAGDPRLAEIQALLDLRLDALVRGDRDAWLGALDSSATPAFVAEQERQFAGLRTVGIEALRLDVDGDAGDLSPPGLADRLGAETFVPATVLRYRITGFDTTDAVDTLWWTYVRRGADWKIAASDDLEVVGLETQRRIWDLGELSVLRAERVMVLSHPDRAARASEVADLLDEAVRTFDERWTRPWSGSIVVVVPSSADEVERILQTTLDLSNFVAFVHYRADRDEGYTTTAPRMYLQDERLAARSRAFQVETLVHELAHAATAADAGPFVDAWVHEGLADWVALGRPSGLAVPDGSDGTIPNAFEFRTGSREDIIRSYDESTSLMSYLADTEGADAPADYFAALGARRVVVGDTDFHVGDTLRSRYGMGAADFADAWYADRGP